MAPMWVEYWPGHVTEPKKGPSLNYHDISCFYTACIVCYLPQPL